MKGVSAMATDFEKLARDTYAAYNPHDIEKFLSLHTDDVVVESVVANAVVAHGKQELRAMENAYFAAFSGLKMEITSCFAFGNRQCEEWVFSGKHTGDFMGIPATGKSLLVRGVSIREFREGKTSKISHYYDLATFMQQLGVLPVNPHK
jgi:steroid delta-isomerase-like uncharacterized protein